MTKINGKISDRWNLFKQQEPGRTGLCVYLVLLMLYFILMPAVAEFCMIREAQEYWKDRPPIDCPMGVDIPDFSIIRDKTQCWIQLLMAGITAVYGLWVTRRAPERYRKFYGLAVVLLLGCSVISLLPVLGSLAGYNRWGVVRGERYHMEMICILLTAAGAAAKRPVMRWTGVGLLNGWALLRLWVNWSMQNDYSDFIDAFFVWSTVWLPMILTAVGLVMLLWKAPAKEAAAGHMPADREHRSMLVLGALALLHQIVQPAVFELAHRYCVDHVFDRINTFYTRECAALDMKILWYSRIGLFLLMAVGIGLLSLRMTEKHSRVRVLWQMTAAMYGTAALLLPALASLTALSINEVWFDAVFVLLLVLMWGLGLGKARVYGIAVLNLLAMCGLAVWTQYRPDAMQKFHKGLYNLWTRYMWKKGVYRELSRIMDLLPIAGAAAGAAALATLRIPQKKRA